MSRMDAIDQVRALLANAQPGVPVPIPRELLARIEVPSVEFVAAIRAERLHDRQALADLAYLRF